MNEIQQPKTRKSLGHLRMAEKTKPRSPDLEPGPLVLGSDPLNSPTPTADRDRTVSRRSEPSSR
jgi:hypothetical protein